jgi:hypothetical protein
MEPLPAGKDEKLSRGAGQSPALSGALRPASTSLDEVQINRNTTRGDAWEEEAFYLRPSGLGRGKHCGRFSMRVKDPASGKTIVKRVHCKSWACSYCGPRRASLSRWRITEWAEKLGLRYFWTLTLPKGKFISAAQAVRLIRRCFNKLRVYLRRHFGESLPFVCVLEFTRAGVPHLHVLFDRFIPQAFMSGAWSALGAGYVVYVKPVTIKRIARYLSKYLSKDLFLAEPVPRRARRITTSRCIVLFPRLIGPKLPWEFKRESIWSELEKYSARFFRVPRCERFRVLDGLGALDRLVPLDVLGALDAAPLALRNDEAGFVMAFYAAAGEGAGD